MNRHKSKRVLLGVDADFSPATQRALRAASELCLCMSSPFSFIIVTVIPFEQTVATNPGMYVGQVLPLAATAAQQAEAEQLVQQVTEILVQQGIEEKAIQSIVRVGLPAEEIAKVAREAQADLIVVGSQGNSLKEKLRRFFFGSTSRLVLELAPCPVMIVNPPSVMHPRHLVEWYEVAIINYLKEHTGTLMVFTAQLVAEKFLPPTSDAPGRKEIAAAALALEQLASSGMLYRRDIEGELLYVND